MFYLLCKFCNNFRNKTPTIYNANISLIKYIYLSNILLQCCLYKYMVVHNVALFFLHLLLLKYFPCFASVFIVTTFHLRFSWNKIFAFFRGRAILVWEPIGTTSLAERGQEASILQHFLPLHIPTQPVWTRETVFVQHTFDHSYNFLNKYVLSVYSEAGPMLPINLGVHDPHCLAHVLMRSKLGMRVSGR